MALFFDGEVTHLRAGDMAEIQIISGLFSVAKLVLLREKKELIRPELLKRGNHYTLPTNQKEGFFLILGLLADCCGLKVVGPIKEERVGADEEDGLMGNLVIRYRFEL
ncbi:MAG: hypothetical protein AAB451_03890 [Patescibacteria group bacterium]